MNAIQKNADDNPVAINLIAQRSCIASTVLLIALWASPSLAAIGSSSQRTAQSPQETTPPQCKEGDCKGHGHQGHADKAHGKEGHAMAEHSMDGKAMEEHQCKDGDCKEHGHQGHADKAHGKEGHAMAEHSMDGKAMQEHQCKDGDCKEHGHQGHADKAHGKEGHAMAEHSMDGKAMQGNAMASASVGPGSTLPAAGAQLTRPARALRIWFDQAPNVAKSSISLEGPNGSMTLQGLHSMGDNDLMIRVVGAMPDGGYTVTWTMVEQSGAKKTGSWSFSIQRAQ